MAPLRILPQVGAPAEIVTLPTRTPVTITAVAGRDLEVRTAAGDTMTFTLHPTTGHFVRTGEPYWGTRLELLAP